MYPIYPHNSKFYDAADDYHGSSVFKMRLGARGRLRRDLCLHIIKEIKKGD